MLRSGTQASLRSLRKLGCVAAVSKQEAAPSFETARACRV